MELVQSDDSIDAPLNKKPLSEILTKEINVLKKNDSELIIKVINDKPTIEKFSGLLSIPELCFNKVLLQLSNNDKLILPETSFYKTYNDRYYLEDKEKIKKTK